MQICKAAGLAREVKIPGKRKELTRYRPMVRIHDLRHTYPPVKLYKTVSVPVLSTLNTIPHPLALSTIHAIRLLILTDSGRAEYSAPCGPSSTAERTEA